MTSTFEHVRSMWGSILWRQFLTWHFLKDPIAVCLASVVPLIIAATVNEFDIRETLNLVYISSTVLLIMLFGTAERVLVSVMHRVIGTLLGAGVGVLLGYAHGAMVNAGDPRVVIYTYQLLVFICVVFVVAFLTRIFPNYYDLFLLFGITVALLLFTADLTVAYSRTASVLIAAVSSTIFTLLFQYTRAEDMLFRDHREASILLLELTGYAVSSEHQEKREFDHSTHRMRECLSSADKASDAYIIWRRLTFRKPRFDFRSLSDALRPLYYEVFSLYWSHVETALRPRDATRLYCNTESDYRTYFKPYIDSLVMGIHEYKEYITAILELQRSHQERRDAVEKVLTIINEKFHANMAHLNIRFMETRSVCFQNRYQRWNMTEYLVTVTCVLIELIEYTQKIVEFFIVEDVEYADLLDQLAMMRLHMNELRFETDSQMNPTIAA